MAAEAPLASPRSAGEAKAGCVALYQQPAVRWLLGGELHPGGASATRRALRLLKPGTGEQLLDIGCGLGDSALLAADELGWRVVGVDLGEGAVAAARAAAEARGCADLASFEIADAEALPFGEGSFDAAICECSLSTFPDKETAAAEMARVVRRGGAVAISDVVAEHERLPEGLRGALAAMACVGGALSRHGYERLLNAAGFEIFAVESLGPDAARLAARLEDRLRGARLLGFAAPQGNPFSIQEAIEAVALARRAIEEGAIGYAIFGARRR